MKRQSETHGVIPLWQPSLLDINPFQLPERYTLYRKGVLQYGMVNHDIIVLEKGGVQIRQSFFGLDISCVNIPISEFSGVAIRVSPELDADGFSFAVSINLHHEYEEFCVPLFFADSMDFASARLAAWADTFNLPVLVPCEKKIWKAMEEPLGRLVYRTVYPRQVRQANFMFVTTSSPSDRHAMGQDLLTED